jgi:hypothetical protein
MHEAVEWPNADMEYALAEAKKGFLLKPEILALALAENSWNLAVGLKETQALPGSRSTASLPRATFRLIVKVLDDTLLK